MPRRRPTQRHAHQRHVRKGAVVAGEDGAGRQVVQVLGAEHRRARDAQPVQQIEWRGQHGARKPAVGIDPWWHWQRQGRVQVGGRAVVR